MKTPEEFKQYILENFRNDDGDIVICNVDLSDFDGNVYIDQWTVKNNLHQGYQMVGGDLYQSNQIVVGYLYQHVQTVGKDLWQNFQEVHQTLKQNNQMVIGNLHQDSHIFAGTLYNHKLKEDEEVIDESDTFIAIKKTLKENHKRKTSGNGLRARRGKGDRK